MALGAMLIMLTAAAVLANQIRFDLRLSAAEGDVVLVEQLLTGEFNRAAAAAGADKTWPTTPAAASDPPCTPATPWVTGQAYPVYCTQVLARTQIGAGKISGYYTFQVPMRVRYQASAGANVETQYGWIILRAAQLTDKPFVWRIYYQHYWCTPVQPGGGMANCEQGG